MGIWVSMAAMWGTALIHLDTVGLGVDRDGEAETLG
jgi:hypothetical protein